jgi:hypothetical protein
MGDDLTAFLAQVNLARYRGQRQGHYESFFQRANHPTRPLAFWIRYTLFSPKSLPQKAVGELWAIFFNGESHQHVAVKQEFPISECVFSASAFDVQVGNARLTSHQLHGAVLAQDRAMAWELSYSGNSDPLLLLPFGLYQTKFPAAKSLVGLPMARYNGRLSVNGEAVDIHDWVGSQNHNWGTRHTDRYAWGQVAGFDTHPESFLEAATARLRLGAFWTPPITPIVLRHQGRELAFNGLFQAASARADVDYFSWRFKSKTSRADIEGVISAPRTAFVGLNYSNPPGGAKHCLNSKIASCSVQLRDKTRGTTETLETHSRAAFEILTDDPTHGIPVSA